MDQNSKTEDSSAPSAFQEVGGIDPKDPTDDGREGGGKATPVLTLSPEEDLAQCEARVRNGLNGYLDLGNALRAIKERKLYQYRDGFKTWEKYCKTVWNISRAHAHRLVAAAEKAEQMSLEGDIPPTKLAEILRRVKASRPPKQKAPITIREETNLGEQETAPSAPRPMEPGGGQMTVIIDQEIIDLVEELSDGFDEAIDFATLGRKFETLREKLGLPVGPPSQGEEDDEDSDENQSASFPE
jgi:hypothetical protein